MKKQSDLDGLRNEIDRINGEILKLLNRRAELAIEVGRVKREMKSDFHVLDREHKIYQKLEKMNKGPFPNSAIRPVFREIISASLSLEHELRVVYLGPEATFSHLAAIKQFGQSATFVQSRREDEDVGSHIPLLPFSCLTVDFHKKCRWRNCSPRSRSSFHPGQPAN